MARSSLDEDQAIELADIFRVLGDPNRLRIAVICLRETLCVTDIAECAGLSAALVSHHLRLLKAARFVQAKRRGKQVFYGTLDDRVRCVIRDMVAHVGGDTAALEKQGNERRTRRKKRNDLCKLRLN